METSQSEWEKWVQVTELLTGSMGKVAVYVIAKMLQLQCYSRESDRIQEWQLEKKL